MQYWHWIKRQKHFTILFPLFPLNVSQGNVYVRRSSLFYIITLTWTFLSQRHVTNLTIKRALNRKIEIIVLCLEYIWETLRRSEKTPIWKENKHYFDFMRIANFSVVSNWLCSNRQPKYVLVEQRTMSLLYKVEFFGNLISWKFCSVQQAFSHLVLELLVKRDSQKKSFSKSVNSETLGIQNLLIITT